MYPGYKKRKRKNMLLCCAAGITVCFGFGGVVCSRMAESTLKAALVLSADLWLTAGVCLILWYLSLFKTADDIGNRELSKQVIERITEYIRLPEYGTGLDVSYGNRELMLACARKNPKARMIGIDHSKYLVFSRDPEMENAEEIHNVLFMKQDACRLSFDNESFDAVTGSSAYHDIPAEDRKERIRETLRCLKKGGTFAIHDMIPDTEYMDMQNLMQELKDSGFEKVQLIDPVSGLSLSRRETFTAEYSGSAILCGKK